MVQISFFMYIIWSDFASLLVEKLQCVEVMSVLKCTWIIAGQNFEMFWNICVESFGSDGSKTGIKFSLGRN